MKILLISDVYFPRVNGVSTSIAMFRRELRALGHTVWLLAPAYDRLSEDESEVLRIAGRAVPRDPEDRFMSYRAALAHLPLLRAQGFDLIHVQTPFVAHYLGQRLARELNIPWVATYHTFFEDYFQHYLPWLPAAWLRAAARAISRRQCNQLDGLIAPSRPLLDVLQTYGVTTPAVIIPTGLEPESFVLGDGAAFRARHGIEADRPLLLYVGRVAYEKNIDFLIDVVDDLRRQAPRILLLIAGEGPALAHLQRRVRRLSLQANVRFLGYLERAHELPACYRAADVFVFASRTETQGLVLLEAMAQGIALVATAELGAKSVLCEGLGVRIVTEQVQTFADQVMALLLDPEQRQRLGQDGRHYARQWSAAAQAARLVSFYQETLDHQRRSAPRGVGLPHQRAARNLPS